MCMGWALLNLRVDDQVIKTCHNFKMGKDVLIRENSEKIIRWPTVERKY